MAVSGKVVGASGRGYSAELTIDGLARTKQVLRGFAPDIKRRLDRALRDIVRNLATNAEANIPAGHPQAQGGMTVKSRKGGHSVQSMNKTAAIFEFAGSKTRGKTPQGAALIRWLDADYGKPGRILWRAWDAGKPRYMADIEKAMADAERDLQDRLDAEGESY